MLYQHNTEKHIVTLLSETATNKYGDKLLWVRCANGKDRSIWEDTFKKQFTKLSD